MLRSFGNRSLYFGTRCYSATQSAPEMAVADTFARFEKSGDFETAYEELILRGFSDTDAMNLVIDASAKKGDEKNVTKLVEKMKTENIAINKRTVLVLRQFATKLVATEKAAIEEEERKELENLEAKLKQ